MTIDERRKATRQAERYLKSYMKRTPDLSRQDARLQILIDNLHKMDEIGQYQDKWFTHPFPTIMEPEKKICHLTDFGDYTINHRAWLYNKASLKGTNIFFANVRRKLSLLERPISTPSALNRRWYGYSPYNPSIINKILLIHRVWYNYVKKSRRTKITPAMKLGLAKAPIDPEVIIYGKTVAESAIKRQNLKPEKDTHSNDLLKGPEPLSKEYPATDLRKTAISAIQDKNRGNLRNDLQTIYLDLETTGTGTDDEIIEIAIVDDAGQMLLNSLVKSLVDIHPEAAKIHGITKEMLAKAPTLKEIEGEIIKLLTEKRVVTYKVSFDMRFLTYSMKSVIAAESCCMLEFAEYYGRLNNEPRPYQWQTLKFAARFVEYSWIGPHHRALSDALACRAIWQYMMKNPII